MRPSGIRSSSAVCLLFSRRSLFRTDIFKGLFRPDFPRALSGFPPSVPVRPAATGWIDFKQSHFIAAVAHCAYTSALFTILFFKRCTYIESFIIIHYNLPYTTQKPIDRGAFLFISFGGCNFIVAPFCLRADLPFRPLI